MLRMPECLVLTGVKYVADILIERPDIIWIISVYFNIYLDKLAFKRSVRNLDQLHEDFLNKCSGNFFRVLFMIHTPSLTFAPEIKRSVYIESTQLQAFSKTLENL